MDAIRLTIFGLTLLAAVSPCNAENEKDEEPEATNEKVCVNSRTISSFDGLSDEYLFIEEGRKTYFLMTMRQRCSGLRDAAGIAVKNSTSRICSDEFGEITFRDRGMGMRTCRIGKIEAVESKDEAKALIEKKKEGKNEAK
jgi:hypothetical protein